MCTLIKALLKKMSMVIPIIFYEMFLKLVNDSSSLNKENLDLTVFGSDLN